MSDKEKLSDNMLFGVIRNITQSLQEQSQEGILNNPLYKFIMDRRQWLQDPDKAYTVVISPFHQIVSQVGQTVHGVDNILIGLLYTDYGFFDEHISNLCKRLYGPPFCADRARWVLQKYCDSISSIDVPEIPEGDRRYNIPPTGDMKSWLYFTESLMNLLCGRPEKYFSAYASLLGSVKEEAAQ